MDTIQLFLILNDENKSNSDEKFRQGYGSGRSCYLEQFHRAPKNMRLEHPF